MKIKKTKKTKQNRTQNKDISLKKGLIASPSTTPKTEETKNEKPDGDFPPT